ncbi:hypothetical protein [Pseudomonas fluorescens]|nr:hypothetical protein [Pseudomonas fluorescens]
MQAPYPLLSREAYSTGGIRLLFNAAGLPISTGAETNGYTATLWTA